jgi:hypothetical protein
MELQIRHLSHIFLEWEQAVRLLVTLLLVGVCQQPMLARLRHKRKEPLLRDCRRMPL